MSNKHKASTNSNTSHQQIQRQKSHPREIRSSYDLARQAVQNREYSLARKIIHNDTSSQHWHKCLKSRISYQTKQPEIALKNLSTCLNSERKDCQQCLQLIVKILKDQKVDWQKNSAVINKISNYAPQSQYLKKQFLGLMKRIDWQQPKLQEDHKHACLDLLRVYEDRGSKLKKVTISEERQGYRVAIAKSLIKPRQMIIFVPENQIITLETAKRHHIAQKIANEEANLKSPKHCLLAVYLLIEKSRGQQSQYSAYIQSLPKNLETFPVYYPQNLCEELRGTSFLSILNRKKNDLSEDYTQVLKIIGRQFNITYDQFVWARMIICSRIFGIIMYGIKTDALVPIADMLNHQIPKMTTWSFSDNMKGFVVENGSQSIGEGEQIFDSYGSKCNSRFLLNYGFIQPDNLSNEVGIILKRDDGRKYSQFNIRISRLLSTDQFKTLLTHFRSEIYYKDNLQEEMGDEEDNEQSKFSKFMTPQIQCRVWAEIEKIFNKKLSCYPTTLAFDQRQLRKPCGQNLRNCIQIRIGQKQVCEFYIKMAKTMKQYFSRHKRRERERLENIDYLAYIKTLPTEFTQHDFS